VVLYRISPAPKLLLASQGLPTDSGQTQQRGIHGLVEVVQFFPLMARSLGHPGGPFSLLMWDSVKGVIGMR
jgi:hypothetical protein